MGSTSEWLWFDAILENPFVVGVWGFRATLYEGEGGALRGALLPITVFLAVKVTGEAGLALWGRALVGIWPCRRSAFEGPDDQTGHQLAAAFDR